MAVQTAFVSTETFTPQEFERWLAERAASDLNHYELLRGRIVMSPPAGWPHGSIGAGILGSLIAFVRPHKLGLALDSSAGYALPSGDTVEPDISFISAARFAAGPAPQPGKFIRIVPTLVVEILSPATAQKDRTEKKALYEENGVEEYWIVDPKDRTVTRYHHAGRRFGRGKVFTVGDTLRSRALPGLRLAVQEIFA